MKKTKTKLKLVRIDGVPEALRHALAQIPLRQMGKDRRFANFLQGAEVVRQHYQAMGRIMESLIREKNALGFCGRYGCFGAPERDAKYCARCQHAIANPKHRRRLTSDYAQFRKAERAQEKEDAGIATAAPRAKRLRA
jgi:hypothetical protein